MDNGTRNRGLDCGIEMAHCLDPRIFKIYLFGVLHRF